MTREEAEHAILIGIRLVQELAEKGYDIIATGEMGIGNTTTSSAVVSVLLGRDPEEVTGRGAGLTTEGLRFGSMRRMRQMPWMCWQKSEVWTLQGLPGYFSGAPSAISRSLSTALSLRQQRSARRA